MRLVQGISERTAIKSSIMGNDDLFMEVRLQFFPVVQATGAINSPDSVKVTQSGPVGIATNEIGDETIMISPNPAHDELQLNSLNQLLLNVAINIYDMEGKLVMTSKCDNASNIKLNIGSFANGSYIVSVKSEQALIRKMFVKY